ncbi:hypothetical protein EsH8_II_000013 [Colletotrichum jinshuiense]
MNNYFSPFAEVPFVLLATASSLGFFAMFVPINYTMLQAQADGTDPNISAYLLAILNAGSLPGRILLGYLGGRLGRFNFMIIMCLLSALTIFWLWMPGPSTTPGSNALYIVFSVLYGFASGALVGMVPAFHGQITADPTNTGIRQGDLFTCTAVASLCGSPIAGAILDN